MKKDTLIVALIAMLFTFTGCDKKDSNSPDNGKADGGIRETPASKFVGKYELFIDYDVFLDGEESDPGSMYGTLTIAAINDSTVSVEGIMEFGSGDAPLYSTTGTVDKDGVLHLEPNEYTGGAVPLYVSYYDIVYGSPLVFKSFMVGYLQNYQMEYEMTNTATKWQ